MLFDLSSRNRDVLALVDCNNFYASCERVFAPALRGKPVVVLSNNDGCAIARSREAKALGVKMGQPYFEWKRLVDLHGIKVLSANFALYGDMSRRVMDVLRTFQPALEIYSIDEAFLPLEGVSGDLEAYGRMIRERVYQCTGIPVTVGISHIRTLAKAANRLAKDRGFSALGLLEPAAVDRWLEGLATQDVWGIGGKKSQWLAAHGCHNALQLKNAPDDWVRKNLSVMTLRTVFELRGIPCQDLEESPPSKKSIATTRSFAREMVDKSELGGLLVSFAAMAAEKMRAQGSAARAVQIFVQSSPFKPDYYGNSAVAVIPGGECYTPRLFGLVRGLLERIYRPGVSYKKAGVILLDLVTSGVDDADLFGTRAGHAREDRLMEVVDGLNGAVVWAPEMNAWPSVGRQERRSPKFTTRWPELLKV